MASWLPSVTRQLMDGMDGMAGAHDDHGGHSHAPGSHWGYLCDGTHWTGMGYQRASNWSTHALPGILVTVWAAHWTVSVFKLWFQSSKQQPYHARTTYKLPFLPESWPVEGCFKALFAWVGIMVQLWWAHGHWSQNICPTGTARAGHFAISAVHNWQNAWTLFIFMMAGVVDIVATRIELPTNMPHFVTAAAFGLQAFGLYQDQYQDMLDGMVYYVFFLVTAATAVAMVFEMLQPQAFWVGCFKCYSMWLQAAWYFCTARILFEGRPAWDSLKPVPDMAPAGFVPVVLVMWMNIVATSMLLVYLCMRWWFAAHQNEYLRARCGVEKVSLTSTRAGHTHELVPLVSRA